MNEQQQNAANILLGYYLSKPMLNYAEAFKVMKNGAKVRIFHENETTHKWVEWVAGQGFMMMTEAGLVAWNPTPTINELQLDCFVILKSEM